MEHIRKRSARASLMRTYEKPLFIFSDRQAMTEK